MKKLISLVLTLCMACMLVPAMADDSAAGTWYLSEMVTNGATVSPSMIGMSWSVVLSDDGTANSVMEMAGEKEEQAGTWTQEDSTVTITIDGQAASFELADGTLTLDQGDSGKAVFTHDAPAEAPAASTTTVAAESEDAFLGTWKLSSMDVMGQTIPVSMISSLGLDLDVTLVVEAGKATLSASFSGNGTDQELQTSFADGKLTLLAEDTEITSLSLTESGELALILPISEQSFSIYLAPADAAEKPAA